MAVVGYPKPGTAFVGDVSGYYLYRGSGSSWTTDLPACDSKTATRGDDAEYGYSVALGEDLVVAGDPRADSGRGAVWVLTQEDNTQPVNHWRETRITASDGVAGDRFGSSVSLCGDTLIIGAEGDDSNRGSAYVFDRIRVNWTERTKLTAPDRAANDYFGSAVALSDGVAFVGAYGDDDKGSGSGSVYQFAGSGAVWTQAAKLTAADGAADDNFGRAVAASRGTLIAAAPGDDSGGADTGSAYLRRYAYSTSEDTTLVVAAADGVLGNDTDADGDALAAVLVTTTAHGSLQLAASGAITYTPDANWYGCDSFSYRASDGSVQTTPAVVTITVSPVEDPTTAVGDTFTIDEDAPLSADILANDINADGDVLAAFPTTNAPAGFDLSDGTGILTYDPSVRPNWSGTLSFKYTAWHSDDSSSTATITVVVTPVNDPPVAVTDSKSCTEDGRATLNVLTNDNDGDGGGSAGLTASVFSAPAHGTVQLAASGACTYTPDPDWNGVDTFRYRAYDNDLYSSPQTVTVTVSPVADAPDAVA
ncbi:MAG: tandem-95 repeat protein, partial [Actinobacteria bacterium]